jgi:uncharacterized protein (TIGR03435 family)
LPSQDYTVLGKVRICLGMTFRDTLSHWVCSVALPVGVFFVAAPHSHGQSSAKRGTFEVASVKLNKSGIREGGCSPFSFWVGQTFTAKNCPLASLIFFAYDISQQQLSMGSSLPLLAEKYDITAKSERQASRIQMKQMLQSLLEDRFNLRLRRETKEMPIYALVVGKNGPTFHKSQAEDDGVAKPTYGSSGQPIFQNASVADLIQTIARFTAEADNRIVVDDTGLTGRYDIDMQPFMDMRKPDGPSVFTAVQEFGLKLEPQKRPIETVTIEHMERPSEN